MAGKADNRWIGGGVITGCTVGVVAGCVDSIQVTMRQLRIHTFLQTGDFTGCGENRRMDAELVGCAL